MFLFKRSTLILVGMISVILGVKSCSDAQHEKMTEENNAPYKNLNAESDRVLNDTEFYAKVRDIEAFFNSLQTSSDRDYFYRKTNERPAPVKTIQLFNQNIANYCKSHGIVENVWTQYSHYSSIYHADRGRHEKVVDYPFEMIYIHSVLDKCKFWMGYSMESLSSLIPDLRGDYSYYPIVCRSDKHGLNETNGIAIPRRRPC